MTSYQSVEAGNAEDADDKVMIYTYGEDDEGRFGARCVRGVFFGIAAIMLTGLTVVSLISDQAKVKIVSSLASTFAKSTSKSSKSSDSAAPEWTLTRSGYDPLGYFTDSSSMSYEFLSGYEAIVEPYAEMELYLPDFKLSDDVYYRWSVCGSDGVTDCRDGKLWHEDGAFTQETVTVPCAAFDELSVKVTKHSIGDDEQLGAFKGSALCMYVRRELRDLIADDLALTMDAMYTLYSTEEKKGQKLYGDDFHNSTYYLQAHHFNAAWRDGDHIHEGLGFLVQHIKITNMFEAAMQTVEPSVSMPYWDFTIDVSDGNLYPQDSYAFTADTFGSITPAADAAWGYTYRNDSIEGGRIPDGRWKDLKADYNYKYEHFDQISSNYGYLRAPWNANPSPYISRFSGYTTTLPACLDHYNWLKDSTFVDFMSDSPYSPHASVHGSIGSVMGCDLMDPLREQGLFASEYQQNKFCQKWSFLIKELYRKNFLSGAEDDGSCSYEHLTSADGQNCHFVCNKDVDAGSATSKYDNMGLQLENLISTQYTGSVLTTEQYNIFRDFICDGDGAKVFAGDHTESASPADPSFWPIHPTLERLTQAKLLAGGFSDAEWPSDSVNDYVCDKAQCYETDSVTGDATLDYHAACCYGHYENDQLLDFITPDKNSGTGETNKETWEALDPTNSDYGMPYIYSSFAWDHCLDSDSLDFDYLLTALKDGGVASSSRTSKNKGSDSYLLMGDDAVSRRSKKSKRRANK